MSIELNLYLGVIEIADRRHLPITDGINRLCAQSLGLRVPEYWLPQQDQEELPMADTS